MTEHAGQSITDMTIDSIAAGGDGVGRVDGLVAFVPRTAPGDRISVRLAARKGFARGVVEKVLRASSVRVEPPCPHYSGDRCGGCQLQHMEYGAQLEAKASIIRDGIARIGRRTIEPPTVEESPARWRYRSKLTLALRRDGAGGAGGAWIAGLHPYDDPGDVFNLDDCPITDSRVVDVWRTIMAAAEHLPAADELRASVRLFDPEASTATAVVEGGDAWPAKDRFFARVESLAALWWRPANGARSLVASRTVAGPGASFSQVNPEVARRLREYVVERIAAHSPRTVVDAYSGSGDLGGVLSESGIRVAAIERDRDAAARCRERLSPPSFALTGTVEAHLHRALPADVVVVNPPRTGLHASVSAQLAAYKPAPRAVIYVSCNPATLGRDLARMPGLRLASVRGFDMFPQTSHVEAVCELIPEGRE